MSDTAIKVAGLSKQYKIGHLQRPDTLRDRIGNSRYFRLLKRRNGNSANGNSHHSPVVSHHPNDSDTIWALKEVSFEVKRGEVVGIIGRNGAGKSTLLKILSRITEPTEGYADIHGRIASLLEVGTGFQPELTGRENIYLNGSILGMKHAEIRRKFDEIVAFAEIEQFIDTPVKHYSSGMYVRLAFAVAAHLDPEILLVDEVLAVGDSAFRKKCLGKMDDVAKDGRTILFVSHDMTSIASLCRRAILFEAGTVVRTGSPGEVIAGYLSDDHSPLAAIQWNDSDEAPGDDTVRLTKVEIRADDSSAGTSFNLSESIQLLMEFRVLRPGMRLNPVFVVKNYLGTIVFSTANYDEPGWSNCQYEAGHFKTSCLIPGHILNEGKYSVDALLVHETRLVRAQADAVVSFSIFDDGTTRGDYLGAWLGIVRPRCEWQTRPF